MLIGLVGGPSKGKSTFFKAATLAEVEISARPFTTLRTKDGEAYVKVECADSYFKVQCNPRYGFCLNHKRFVPVRLMDVPGLVEGASEGKGMGNQFLDSLNEADALIHIVDISGSTDKNGNQVERLSHNPEEDIKFLENELDQWYLRIIKKGWVLYTNVLYYKALQDFYFLTKDKKYITPASSSILPSITNKSLQQLAVDFGMTVENRPVPVTELPDFVEVGACGTAAVITPICSIKYGDKTFTYGQEDRAGEMSVKLYKQLQGIQYGEVEDKHDWMTKLKV